MTKYKNKLVGEYRSRLEAYTAKRLKEENINFCYECWCVPLIPYIKEGVSSYEKSGKKFKFTDSQRATTYTPDFVGDNWVIETKGKRTPDFVIKWKLFKKYILDNYKAFTLYMPTSQKEVELCINLIKSEESKNQIYSSPVKDRIDAKKTNSSRRKRTS